MLTLAVAFNGAAGVAANPHADLREACADTYVAAIFRAALERHYDQEFVINILILLGFTACSLTLAQRKLDWRLA